MNKIIFGLIVFGCVFVTNQMIYAKQDSKTAMEHMDHSKMMGMDPNSMTEEQKAQHERMMAYSTPNENHKILESLAGHWKTSSKFWMDPAGEPMETEGTSESKIVMNGRFLEQNYTGSFMGQPFEGRGILGYDNMRKEYTSIWFDNMATGIMVGSAQYDPSTKTLNEQGSMSCPMTNETHRKMRNVTTIIDDNTYKYESYMTGIDGKEFRAMEIIYSRIK